MASYVFSLDKIHISRPRSTFTDTDWVSLAVNIGGNTIFSQTIRIGDVKNGDHSVNLKSSPFLLDNDPNQTVAIHFHIENSGQKTQSQMDNVMGTIDNRMFALYSKRVIQKTDEADLPTAGDMPDDPNNPNGPTASVWGKDGNNTDWIGIIKQIVTLGLSLLAPGRCDGPVADDQIIVDGAKLATWTANGPHNEVRKYEGLDSPFGCGANSRYFVFFNLTAVG
jgi:hypothetical protein